MKKFLFLVLILFVIDSCKYSMFKEEVVSANEILGCPQYFFEQGSLYAYDDRNITYNLKPVLYNNVNININKLEKYLNKGFNNTRITFNVLSPDTVLYNSKIINLEDALLHNFKYGYITMVIMPDSLLFAEELQNRVYKTIYGKADGIPEEDNVSLGRPTFIIKSTKVFTEVVYHEIGHVFSLHHTWRHNDIYNDGMNCDTGDKINDTPNIGGVELFGLNSCNVYIPSSIKERLTTEQIKELSTTYMSRAPYECTNHFSEVQIQRMHKQMEVNPLLQAAEYRTLKK